jgi:uncharacterized membrane protein YhhN
MDIQRDHLVNGIAYALATAGALIASTKDSHALEYLCRPLMLVVLSSWFFFNSRRYGDRFTLLIQAGLFFSLIGDVALMFQHVDEFNFLIGLGAFLIAHLCYCMAFVYNISEVGGTDGMFVNFLIAVLLAVVAVLFSWELVPRLDDGMSLPVLSFIITVTCVGVLAGFRYMRTFPRSFWMVLTGAVLLAVSDGLLTTIRFIKPLAWGPAAVLFTYALAQPMIAAGALIHVLDPDTIRRRQALEA